MKSAFFFLLWAGCLWGKDPIADVAWREDSGSYRCADAWWQDGDAKDLGYSTGTLDVERSGTGKVWGTCEGGSPALWAPFVWKAPFADQWVFEVIGEGDFMLAAGSETSGCACSSSSPKSSLPLEQDEPVSILVAGSDNQSKDYRLAIYNCPADEFVVQNTPLNIIPSESGYDFVFSGPQVYRLRIVDSNATIFWDISCLSNGWLNCISWPLTYGIELDSYLTNIAAIPLVSGETYQVLMDYNCPSSGYAGTIEDQSQIESHDLTWSMTVP